MYPINQKLYVYLIFIFLALISAQAASAQSKTAFEVIEDKDLLKTIVPTSFYFAGLSGGTQMRNSAVAKLGEKRHVVAGLIDVSGYSTEISGVFEGFFITDSLIEFGGKKLAIGAYGIGFAKAGKVNIFDLSGKQILSTETSKDDEMRRPRPLMMVAVEKGIRLYKGRDYVLISPL